MTDDETPTSITDEPGENGEGWVVTTNYSMRRAPGILDTPDTTYVAPPRRIPRRTLIIGSGIALASIAIGAGLVVAANQGGNEGLGESEVSAAATLTSTTTLPEATTTTTAPPPPPSSTAPKQTTATTAAPVSGGAVPAAAPAPAPTPPATANPALGPYQPVPVPLGVSATLSGCSWGGGNLQSAGTITSHSATGRTWTVTTHWLQGGRSLAQQTGAIDLAPGESKPWSQSLPLNAPADLACSLEIG